MNKQEPAFKLVLGSAWTSLPLVFQKRYMNRAHSNDVVTVEGKMDIHISKAMSCYLPIFRLFRVLVPYAGKDTPVKVDFRSDPNSDAVHLDRKFYFENNKPYEFNSRMQPIKENEVIEYMNFGIGWKTNYFYDGKKIVMQHKAYVLKIFGMNVPLPLEMFLGKGYAEEEVIDENSYHVTMSITHPVFGLMYAYSGNFIFKRLPA